MPEEYKGLMAQAWDLLRGETSAWPDRPFYRTLIEQRGGPALDVGCGAGPAVRGAPLIARAYCAPDGAS